MSVSDAYCTATCDKCGTTEDVELTALAARNEYDMRNVESRLERNGWYLPDGLDGDTICEDCKETTP